MTLGYIVLAVAIAGALYYVKFKQAKPTASAEPSPQRKKNEFHAVSIRPGMNSCQISREMRDVRFLPDEVPLLPLDGCDEADCTCRFRHFSDRREEDNRRTPFQESFAAIAHRANSNRRLQESRRKDKDEDDLTLL